MTENPAAVSTHRFRTELSRMMVLVEIVRRGSFAAAARELSVAPSAVSVAIAELESTVGARLLQRTTRQLRLTQVGEVFFEHCLRIAQEAEAAFAVASSSTSIASGTLRVACQASLAADLVVPVLWDLRREHGLLVDLCVDDRRRSSLVEDGFDAAVRVGSPNEAGLTVRRLGSIDEVVVAVPDLAVGLDSPAALGAAPWAVHSERPRRIDLTGPHGPRSVVVASAVATVDSTEALVAMARAGLGVAVVPRSVVAQDLAAGTLVELLPDHRVQSAVFVVLPTRQHLPLRTRLLVDKLAARMELLAAAEPLAHVA